MDSQNVSEPSLLLCIIFCFTYKFHAIELCLFIFYIYVRISHYALDLQKYRNVAAVNSVNSLASVRRQEGESQMIFHSESLK